MSAGDTVVSLLTPPGTGAIAVVEVRGPRAWGLARLLFRPAGKPLPDTPELHRFWFGTLGKDEGILSVAAADAVEVHCHGGRRVVRWVIDQFLSNGAEERTPRPEGEGFEFVQRAPTLRTASILLDQFHGAFDTAVRAILALLDSDPGAAVAPLQKLAGFAPVGKHLVEPWKVVVSGPPNVGKSSLVNAIAGYQRAVVSNVAGTTRDAVGVRVALDGWPVELIDTAGLRDADGLEAEGVDRARHELAEADLALWVLDGGAGELVWPDEGVARDRLLVVVNKSDALDPGHADAIRGLPCVSALTGTGLEGLAAGVVRRLVPVAPAPGDAVPFTRDRADQVEAALTALVAGEPTEAARFLRDCLPTV